MLTLRQTGKAPPLPIVLFDKGYWQSVIKLDALVEHGMINENDRKLCHFAESAEGVWKTLVENGLVVPS
jgi:predicted Rossmann-fold nucleotide-binding protein